MDTDTNDPNSKLNTLWHTHTIRKMYYPRRWYDWILYLIIIYMSIWVIIYY